MRHVPALGFPLPAILLAASLLAPRAAHADERAQCAAAADQGQQLRDDGKYRRAREQFLLCARDACPGPIKRDCLDWLAKVDEVAPTVVFSAKDGDRDVTDVKVSIDGAAVTERLDGKPVLVDSGEHTFRFEHGGQVKEQKVLVSAGQKGRNIPAQFGAAAVAKPEPSKGGAEAPSSGEAPRAEGSLVPAFVVGGIGVIGLGSFGFFALSGMSGKSDLDKCKGHCDQADVDSVRKKFLIADVSLGVGVVALGIATYLVLTRPHLEDHVNVKTGLRDVRFDVTPVAGGAAASFGATF